MFDSNILLCVKSLVEQMDYLNSHGLLTPEIGINYTNTLHSLLEKYSLSAESYLAFLYKDTRPSYPECEN